MRSMKLMCLVFASAAVLACSSPREAPDPERVFLAPPQKPPVDEDGRHFLAKKPLKIFSEERSKAWRTKEAIDEAKQRQKEYRDQHSAAIDPTSPDPHRGMSLTLAQALKGLDGRGALRADLVTTEGTISCELLPEQRENCVSHFVALARGGRPWWNGAVGAWKKEPYYRNLPIYRIARDEAFHTGCPMGVGFAEIGFRGAPSSLEGVTDVAPPGTLGIPLSTKTMTMGPQFFVTGRNEIKMDTPFIPIGRCEAGDDLDGLLAEPLGDEGLPIRDLVLIRVDVHRGGARGDGHQ